MALLTQEAMNRLFEVTDELEIDREALTVPLEMAGEGGVERAGTKIEIRLPDEERLDEFLAGLPRRLGELQP